MMAVPIKKILGLLFFVALGLLVQSSTALADPIISIEPPSTIVGLGAPFSLDVRVTGVVDLYAYQFDISFDPTILQAVAVDNGGFLPPDLFFPGLIDNTGGSITFILNAVIGPGPGVSGDGTLATLTFNPAGLVGTSPIGIANAGWLDSTDDPLNAPFRTFDVVGGSVSVTPEPGSLVLLAGGLVAMVTLARRKGA